MAEALKSILVVEDDHDTRVSLRNILEAEGYFVFSAANGKQALDFIKDIRPPCLILLDMVMPAMNGEEFVAAISSDSALHMIPVVLISAFPEVANKVVAKSFMRKPIDLDALLNVVRHHCACVSEMAST